MTNLKYKLLVVTVAALFIWALAADIPFTFKAGDVISAEQMNQNFTTLNTAKQERVSNSCPAGSSIRSIAEDGTVTCEVDDIGPGTGDAGVDAINGMTGAVTLQAGNNITIDDSQKGQIRISASSGGTNSNNHDHFGQTWTNSADTSGLTIINTNASDTVSAMTGRSGAGSNFSVAGELDGAPGVWGDSQEGVGVIGSSLNDRGVFGFSTNADGVMGLSNGRRGIYGVSNNTDDGSVGVEGFSNGYGVKGTGTTAGILGLNSADFGYGVHGVGGIGVYAQSNNEANADLMLHGAEGLITGKDLMLKASGSVTLRLDRDNNTTNTFGIRNGSDTLVFSVAESGDAIMAGTLTQGSDRNIKHKIQAVNSRDILEKVAAMPVSSWRYNADPSAKHIGPMAQDFYAAFGLGSTDKGIATVDADGISLAAIQGLYQLVQEQQAKIEALEAQLAALK